MDDLEKKCFLSGCKKRLILLECSCGKLMCAQHVGRDHDCHKDFKNEQKRYLEKMNPKVEAVKLYKI